MCFIGCDVTSNFYNEVKNTFITIFNNDKKLLAATETFYG